MGIAGEALIRHATGQWSAFAEKRRLHFFERAGLPACDGCAHGTDVALAIGGGAAGFRTRATAVAKIALRGNVQVRAPGLWDQLMGSLRRRRFFADPRLDRLLVVKSTSRPLAHTIVDERVIETLGSIATRQVELGYVSGAISIEWEGIECNAALLDDILDVLAHLAVRGSEASPYR